MCKNRQNYTETGKQGANEITFYAHSIMQHDISLTTKGKKKYEVNALGDYLMFARRISNLEAKQ